MKTTHQLIAGIVLLFSLAFGANADSVEVFNQAQLFQSDAAPSDSTDGDEKKKAEEEPDC